MDKKSKEAVAYVAKSSRSAHCATCTMFYPPSSCSAVHGKIDPAGWCKLYEPRKARSE